MLRSLIVDFTRPLRSFLATIVVVGVAIVSSDLLEGILASSHSTTLIQVVLTAGMVWLLLYISQDLRDLRQQMSCRIRFVGVTPEEQARVFRETMRYVRRAKKSIRVLNSFAEEKYIDKEWSRAGQERDAYFALLEEKMKSLELYERVVQVEPGEDIATRYHEDYIAHFHSMVSSRSARERAASSAQQIDVIKINRLFPSTFLIIDDAIVVWQLNRILARETVGQTATKERVAVRAVVVLEATRTTDPLADPVISLFHEWWSIARHAERRETLSKAHLGAKV